MHILSTVFMWTGGDMDGADSATCHDLHLEQPQSLGEKCKLQNSYTGSVRILADTKSNYSLCMLVQLLIFSQEI